MTMNKLLLTAVAAAISVSANAQVRLNPSEITDLCKLEIAKQRVETRAPKVGNMYYYRPAGLFYSGWNRDLRNPDVAFAPINTPVKYTAVNLDGTAVWKYPSGKMVGGEPEILEKQGGELELSLPKGVFPSVEIYNADNANDMFFPLSKVDVGGKTGKNNKDGKILDAYAVNYVPEGNLHSMSAYFSTNNTDADARLAEVLQLEDMHVKGFGEKFVSTAPMKVMGFNILVLGDGSLADNPEKVLPSIVTYDEGQGFHEIKTYADFDVEVSAIEGLDGMFELLFTLKGEPVEVEAGRMIMPVASSEDIWFTPLFDSQTRWDEAADSEQGITTMYVSLDLPEGADFRSFKGLSVEDNTGAASYINSWCFGLHMSYADSDASAGIDNIQTDVDANNAVYTVDGVRVGDTTDNLPAGVYVVGGKKVIVR